MEKPVDWDGSTFEQMVGPGTYAWLRGVEWLYVGATANIMSRLANHTILRRKALDRVREGDTVLIWPKPTKKSAKILESRLINKHSPKYNVEILGEVGGKKVCASCGEEYLPKRHWQKYCSISCKNGVK